VKLADKTLIKPDTSNGYPSRGISVTGEFFCLTQFNSSHPHGGVPNASAANGNAAPGMPPANPWPGRLADVLGWTRALEQQGRRFPPRQVAERILGFIGGRLESQKALPRPRIHLELRGCMHQGKWKGVEAGFCRGTQILEAWGVLAGNIASGIARDLNLNSDRAGGYGRAGAAVPQVD